MKEKSTLKDVANNYLTHTKEVKGITLVALVVTIIVLIILAGVAISLTIGNNGIFKRAGDSADKYKEASKNEEDEMKNAADFLNNYLSEKNNGDDTSDGETDEDEEQEIAIPITESEWDLSSLSEEEKHIDGYYLIKNNCTIKGEIGDYGITSTGDKVLKIDDGVTCTVEEGAFEGNVELGTNSTLIIYGGTFNENVKILSGAKLVLYGGTIGKNVELEDNSILETGGGMVNGNLIAKSNVTMNIGGGTFMGDLEIGANCSVKITNGTFAVNPSQYVPTGYRVEQSDGWYMVVYDG